MTMFYKKTETLYGNFSGFGLSFDDEADKLYGEAGFEAVEGNRWVDKFNLAVSTQRVRTPRSLNQSYFYIDQRRVPVEEFKSVFKGDSE